MRADGRLVSGPSLSCRVAKTDVDLDTDLQAKLSTALTTTAPKPAHRVADGAQLYCGASVLKNTPRFCAWDVSKSSGRVGDFESGGVGLGEIKRLQGSDILAVANGGVDAPPISGA